MSLQVFKKGRGAGKWWPCQNGGARSATIGCPKCGRFAGLFDHTIAQDGKVTPSAVCPYGCGWHENIVLEGWTPAPGEAP